MTSRGDQGGANAVLRWRDAAVGYGTERVLGEVGLSVASGEIVGLVGPNGSGKSTLLRSVTGDSDLLNGTLTIAGRDAREIAALQRAQLVGVVPQQVSAAFSLPASEFVAMGRHPHLSRFAVPGPRDAEVVERAMRMTDTLRLADKPTDALSGGDLQRLSFAQALAQEPSVLLLDEPTSHLDLNHRMQVLDLTRELADAGMAVLAVFHDLDLAARYADRVGIVAAGSLSALGAPADVITQAALSEVFGVRAVVGTDVVTGAVSVTPVLREVALEGPRRGRVLVIGGSGAAAPLVRRLVLGGWEVGAGALNTGDADQVVASALGTDYVALPPFAPMDARAEADVLAWARGADAVVVTEVPFGHGNLGNLRAAVQSGRPLVLVGSIAGRDFTGGQAQALWSAAVAAGATVVQLLDDVDATLASVARSSDEAR